MTTKNKRKRQKLRNNEYYDLQKHLDDLYNKSSKGYKFTRLYDQIISKENILLAYRNIKKNTGGKTSGTDGKTIEYLENLSNEELIKHVRDRLENYRPDEVRRVEIPKANGKVRPLGIPTISDRLIQQCIKQILEPICEAKFHNHSYGFRPNRSTEHAIARYMYLVNKAKLHYVVDVDIQGFFDNVNHSKLLKQIWTLGIRDKKVLSIISKMLKAPVENEGVPTKGTPQGGILSPLLSNIVLNELDWWVSDQWETFKTENEYSSSSNKSRSLKRTKLKQIYIVRYADDFKIVCANFNVANKMKYAIKDWLKERLHLEISEEKSKVVNLKTNYSEFLGFKLKVKEKANKYVVKSHMSDKAKVNVQNKLKAQVIEMKRNPHVQNVNRYNAMVLGMQTYYKIATNVNADFSEIAYNVNRSIFNRLRSLSSETRKSSESYNKLYGKYNFKKYNVMAITLFPIAGVTTRSPMNFTQDICNYTAEGRALIHKNLRSVNKRTLKYLMDNPIPDQTTEFNDNRISLYVGQNGICPISETLLEIGEMDCHHKKPKHQGGTDEYSNLIFVKKDVHKLIHATDEETINRYVEKLQLDKKQIDKLNKLRVLVGNVMI